MTPPCPPPEEWEFYRLHGVWRVGPDAERYAQARAEKLSDWPEGMPEPPPYPADDEGRATPEAAPRGDADATRTGKDIRGFC